MKLVLLTALWFFIQISSPHSPPKYWLTGIYIVIGEANDDCKATFNLINTSQFYCLSGQPVIEVYHFESVSDLLEKQLERRLIIQLDDHGTEKLRKLTSVMKGRRMAIVINDQLFSIPVVTGEITSGRVELGENLEFNQLRLARKWLVEEIGE